MSGTVNISRSIWRDEAFKPEPFTEREAFMWMVMDASYKPRKKAVGNIWVDLERGQLACSVRFMCEAWGWSKSRVDRFLKRLENRDMIGTASGTGVNVITVCKYDEYQNAPNGSGTPKKENRDSSGTAAGQQRDKPNKGLIPDASQMKETEDTNVSLFAPAIDEIAECVSAYNTEAVRWGWPRVQSLNKKRRAALAGRLREAGGPDGWRLALKKAGESDFLTGRASKQFFASFDFLTQQSSFAKLMEGNYDNRTGNGQASSNHFGTGGPGSGTVAAFAAVAERLERERAAGQSRDQRAFDSGEFDLGHGTGGGFA